MKGYKLSKNQCIQDIDFKPLKFLSYLNKKELQCPAINETFVTISDNEKILDITSGFVQDAKKKKHLWKRFH